MADDNIITNKTTKKKANNNHNNLISSLLCMSVMNCDLVCLNDLRVHDQGRVRENRSLFLVTMHYRPRHTSGG
jgi:hypothetical protein